MVAPHLSPHHGDPPEIARHKARLRERCVASLRARDTRQDAGVLTNLKILLGSQLFALPLPGAVPNGGSAMHASGAAPSAGASGPGVPYAPVIAPQPGRASAVVACVWPLPHELDLRPLCHWLDLNGATVVLPETPPRGNPLVFRQWRPGCAMLAGRFGTQVPDGPVMQPDMVLVPLLGFDRAGNRLGYGGGYYDRTLAAMPHVARIGYAPSTQEVESLPAGPHDQPLPCIVTDKETLCFD
ncbi:MAG: 5-formyltetrahydrofolate cyclo-ligase [Acetobacter sp.]